MVSSTPRPHFTPGKDPVTILQEAGWAGKSRLHRDSIPDRSARSSVAIPTELPGPQTNIHKDAKYRENTFNKEIAALGNKMIKNGCTRDRLIALETPCELLLSM